MHKITIGTNLSTGKPFEIDADEIIMGRTFLASVTRYGKSWTNRHIIEQLVGFAGLVIIDPEGEYSTLREKFPFLVIGKDIPLQIETAEFMAETTLKEGMSVIIDLSLIDEDVAKEYVAAFVKRFMFLETKLRKPYLIVCEEADEMMPEKGVAKATSLRAFKNVAKKGGKRGVGLIVTTHRPAFVSKMVLSQCTTLKIIGRIEWASDLDVIKDFLQVSPDILRRPKKNGKPVDDGKPHIDCLKPGQFYFAGSAVQKDAFVKVGKVLTTHLGCYTEDVKVMTPNGLKTYNECKKGDRVFSLNVNTGLMEEKTIEHIYIYDYVGAVYSIKGIRVNNSVTPNHRMLIKTRHKSWWRFEEGDEVFSRYEFYVPVTSEWAGEIPPYEELVPICSELQSQRLGDMALGDLLDVAGWYIAEGFTAKAKKACKTKTLTTFCTPISDLKRINLENLLLTIGLNYHPRADCIRVHSRRLCKFLEQFGNGAENKHIPTKFLKLPPYLLNRLFSGMTRGDGWDHKSGATKGLPYGYSTISEHLTENTAELALKLGLQPRIKRREPREHELSDGRIIHSQRSWDIYFVRYGKGHIRVKDHVLKEHYEGKVWCFEIADNGNMLVSKNGTFMFCGNSTPELLPPAPKELESVIAKLTEALPKIIEERIKPALPPIEEIRKEIEKKIEAKLGKKLERDRAKLEAKYRNELVERDGKIKKLEDHIEAVSRTAALTPSTSITDVLQHPIVKTTMLKLPARARDLLTKIQREPDLTREQLAAFLSASRDTIAHVVQKINRTFKATVIIGRGRPIKYRSVLERLFLTDVADREISEIERLQTENRKLKDDKETLTEKNRALYSENAMLIQRQKRMASPEEISDLRKEKQRLQQLIKEEKQFTKEANKQVAKLTNIINSVKKALELPENEVPLPEPELVVQGAHGPVIMQKNVATQSETTKRMVMFLHQHPKTFFTERELALALGYNADDESFRNALASLPSLIEKTEKGFRIGDE